MKLTISEAGLTNFADLGNLDGFRFDLSRTDRSVKLDRGCARSIEEISRRSGRYVMAVDYNNNRPILCEFVSQGTGSLHRAQSTADGVINAQQDASVSTVLSCGSLQVTISSGAVFRDERLVPTGDGYTGSIQTSSNNEIRSIDYLDMRHDLVVIRERISKRTESLTPLGESTSVDVGRFRVDTVGEVNSSTLERDTVRYKDNMLVSFELSDTKHFTQGSQVFSSLLSGTCAGTVAQFTVRNTYYPELVVSSRTEGSWVVDSNGNLLVSQTKGAHFVNRETGQIGTGEFFNFLTNGDLKTVIPMAPEDARYYPIYVVK